jgi:hypothetical protein
VGEPEQPHESPTASAVPPTEPAAHPSDKIDKIGELADFPENQPRSTNDLQQPKSSSANFEDAATRASVTPDVRRGLTSPDAPATPQPPSADAARDSQPTPTAQPIQHLAGVPHLCGPEPRAIPKSSNPFFYYSPEELFVPSTPFNSGEPIRLFLARCREADLAAHGAGLAWGEGQTGTSPSAVQPVSEPETHTDQHAKSHPNMTIALPASNLTMACSPAGGRSGKEFYG